MIINDKKSKIRKVKEFVLGATFGIFGEKCYISEFPTRSTIIVKALNPVAAGWIDKKVNISYFRKNATDVWGRPLRRN